MPQPPTYPIPDDAPKKDEIWQHFKGNHYYIIGVGYHSETGQTMVAYSLCGGDGTIFFRPLHSWQDWIADCARHRFIKVQT